jgi:type VI secretion system protein ImpA
MPTVGGQGPSMPASRIEAVTQLKYIAAYFRQSEPHNPVGYLAEKAAEWADMPLHQWLRKVMHDEGELAHLEEVLGAVSRPGSGENETLSGGE